MSAWFQEGGSSVLHSPATRVVLAKCRRQIGNGSLKYFEPNFRLFIIVEIGDIYEVGRY